jgi:hypothetical protein
MKNSTVIRVAMSRTIIAWTAMLMMTLAPSVSAALAHRPVQQPDAFLMQICRVFSSEPALAVSSAIADGNGAPAPVSTPNEASIHCLYCVMHASVVMPLPGSDTIMAMTGQVLYKLAPTLFYQSPQPLFSWTVAHSRAPPAWHPPA